MNYLCHKNLYIRIYQEKMKKLLLMFATIAVIAFIGCINENKSSEVVAEEPAAIEYTIDGVASDLLDCADEDAAISLLDGIKADAEELLNGGDQAGYFNIINILRTVWENNKDALLAKIPTLADKMASYIEVPDNLKAGFDDFAARAAAEKVGDAVDAACDAAVNTAAEEVSDVGNAVDMAKEKAKEAAIEASKDNVSKSTPPKRLPPDSITGD